MEINNLKIMGILNVTPDSFSDGGKYSDVHSAVEHAVNMIDSGVDIIDLGGESSRPGSDPVSQAEELQRIIPVLELILEKRPNAVISIDTYKSKTAYEALKRGAKIINDISGLTFDNQMADVVANFNAEIVIMHIKGTPKNMQNNPNYAKLIPDIIEWLNVQVEMAKSKGIQSIIIDPGIGFGKTIENNFEIINSISKFKKFGYPILIGLSRKSFLGASLNLPVSERDTSTIISETVSFINGADIIRTHNFENALQLKKLSQYFNKSGQ